MTLLAYVLVVLAAGMILWALNRFLTKLRNPPKFRFNSLLSIMVPPALWGFMLASVPFWILVGLMWMWFYTLASKEPVTSPNGLNFEGVTPLWSTGPTFDADAIAASKRGRFGIALLALAIIGVYESAKMFIPASLNPHYDDDITKETADAFDAVRDKRLALQFGVVHTLAACAVGIAGSCSSDGNKRRSDRKGRGVGG
jgi:hypothetical protein